VGDRHARGHVITKIVVQTTAQRRRLCNPGEQLVRKTNNHFGYFKTELVQQFCGWAKKAGLSSLKCREARHVLSMNPTHRNIWIN